MNALIPFEANGWQVRAIEIDGEPWFVASDVAKALGYRVPKDAIAAHCKGAAKRRLPTAGGEQQVTIIPERDVYRLIMRSRLPEAERFEEWVVGEVLPQIRKTGIYGVPQTFAEALQLAADQQRQIEKQRPAVEFYQAVTDSKTAIPMGQVAKVLDMGVGRNKLFQFLRDAGVLRSNNEPYQEYIDRGWFRVVEQKFQKPNGDTEINIKTLVYQKGVEGIRKLLVEMFPAGSAGAA